MRRGSQKTGFFPGLGAGGTELDELRAGLLKLYCRVESCAADTAKADMDRLSTMARATATPSGMAQNGATKELKVILSLASGNAHICTIEYSEPPR